MRERERERERERGAYLAALLLMSWSIRCTVSPFAVSMNRTFLPAHAAETAADNASCVLPDPERPKIEGDAVV